MGVTHDNKQRNTIYMYMRFNSVRERSNVNASWRRRARKDLVTGIFPTGLSLSIKKKKEKKRVKRE